MVSGPLGLTPSMYIPIVEVETSIGYKCLRCVKGVNDGLESIQCRFGSSTGFELETPCEARVCVEDKEDGVLMLHKCHGQSK